MKGWVLGGLPILAAAAFVLLTHARLAYTPDSPSYLFFDPTRPVVYPAFLALIHALSPRYGLLAWAQTLIMGGSISALILALRRASGAFWLCLAVELLAVANPSWWNNGSAVMSEALSSALTNLFVAVALWRVAGCRRWTAPSFALVIALAVGVRPVNIVFGPAAMLMELLLIGPLSIPAAGRLATRWALIIAGVLAGYFVTPLTQRAIHGEVVAANPLARGLLQKTMFDDDGPPPATIDKADFDLIQTTVQPARLYLAQAPAPIRPVVERGFSDFLRFEDIIPQLARRHGFEQGWRVDGVLYKYAVAQIEHQPWRYVDRVLIEDWRLLSYQQFLDRQTQAGVDRYLKTHPLPQYSPVTQLANTTDLEQRAHAEFGMPIRVGGANGHIHALSPRSGLILTAQRALYLGAAALGLLGLIGALFPGTPASVRSLLVALATLGLLVHAEALLTTLSEYGLVRYIVPLWPQIALIYGLSFAVFVSRLGKVHRT
ncbi:MAG TPA: hypothetical protein VMU59_09795 [Caulobacteraceae bacterium]|nr:hypothetical protein [Caulobacteraceae bacterium]